MPTPVSIKTRIARRIRDTLSGTSGIGTARLWDIRDSETPLAHSDAMVILGTDSVTDESQGNPGYYTKTLTVDIYVRVLQDEDAAQSTSELCLSLEKTVETAMLTDPRWTDAAPAPVVPLALDTSLVSVDALEYDTGMIDVALSFAVQYQVTIGNPTTGPGVAVYEE